MKIHPFKALRATPESASSLASVPYDVVDTIEARKLAEGNPLSFLRVLRSEIDLPANTDPYSDAVYAKAADNLAALVASGHLVRETDPVLYAYRMTMGGRAQVGLLACCSIDEYEKGTIKKHELTRRDKEDDRTKHMVALKAQPGPVLVAYRDQGTIEGLLASAVEASPMLTCQSETGVRHEIWTIADTRSIIEAFARIPHVYIADGHHRSASAARVREHFRSANSEHTGTEEYNYFLTALFPASQLNILAYNRVVSGLNGHTPSQVLELASEKFDIYESDSPVPRQAKRFCAYVGGKWHELAVKLQYVDETDPVKSLDCSIVQNLFIEPILGVGDIRTDPRIKFVGGARGTETLVQKVGKEGDGVAFSLYPTSIEQLMAIADADQIMPPKSTWFEPKLRSGLVVHLI